MIKKNFIKIIFIFLLASCGYSPMLSTMDNKILNIEVVSHEGDKEINQVLRSKFKIHRNENEELIKISINSSYKKKDLSKNLTGKVEDYKIETTTSFIVIRNKNEKNFSFSEEYTIKNFDDDFEERNYEKKIRRNVANINYQKLMLQLYKLNDL
jgi:hypothetical protein|tara:strand:- start:535 stop:996 length:462 start_codon:yes stop_codon:yes gene_type:complete